jgi:hypothetical protein
LLDIGVRGEVIAKAIGIERDVDRLDAFPFGSEGERGEDNFRGRGGVSRGFQTSVGLSGRGARYFGDRGDGGDGGSGGDGSHVGCG